MWGGLHGFYLWVEKFFTDLREKRAASLVPVAVPIGTTKASLIPEFATSKKMAGFVYALFTFFLVNVTWVFFRSADFTQAWHLLGSMFGQAEGAAPLLPTLSVIKITVIISIMLIVHWLMRNSRVLEVARRMHWSALGFIWAALILLIIWSQESSSSFIYFQF